MLHLDALFAFPFGTGYVAEFFNRLCRARLDVGLRWLLRRNERFNSVYDDVLDIPLIDSGRFRSD